MQKLGISNQANEPSNIVDRVNKFDNTVSFDAKQNALPQILFEL